MGDRTTRRGHEPYPNKYTASHTDRQAGLVDFKTSVSGLWFCEGIPLLAASEIMCCVEREEPPARPLLYTSAAPHDTLPSGEIIKFCYHETNLARRYGPPWWVVYNGERDDVFIRRIVVQA